MKYLVAPRLVAGIIMLPCLVMIADIIGIMGGYLVGVNKLGFSSGNYLRNSFLYLEVSDVVSGLVKAAIFGFIISLMGCYNGYNSQRGAQGVGAATTNAVVASSIMILLCNYFITELFFSK
jgi:phospholipid/cholesterol/gamma-HCH transport system permease protein